MINNPIIQEQLWYRYKCIVHRIELQIDNLLFSLRLFTGLRFILFLCLHACKSIKFARKSQSKAMTHLPLRTLSLVVLPFSIFSGCLLRSRCLRCGREKPVQPTLLFCIQRFGELFSAFTDALFTNNICQYELYAIKEGGATLT